MKPRPRPKTPPSHAVARMKGGAANSVLGQLPTGYFQHGELDFTFYTRGFRTRLDPRRPVVRDGVDP